jgi:hypothetical protein
MEIVENLHLLGGFNQSEKYVRQLFNLYPTEWKNHPNVPNHQPEICLYKHI